MKTTTMIVPIRAAVRPFLTESDPSDGPTVRSSMMWTGAGSAPARSTIERSFEVWMSKLPVIDASPPVMRSRITGAEFTLPSSTIAS